jgi:hypothetical protein
MCSRQPALRHQHEHGSLESSGKPASTPTVVVQPSELSSDPKAHAAGMSIGVLVAADRGKVQIPQAVDVVEVDQHPTASGLQIPWRKFPQNAGCLPPNLTPRYFSYKKGGRCWKYSKQCSILPRAAGFPLMLGISTYEPCGREISRKIASRNLDFFVQFSKLDMSRLRVCDLRAGIARMIDWPVTPMRVGIPV